MSQDKLTPPLGQTNFAATFLYGRESATAERYIRIWKVVDKSFPKPPVTCVPPPMVWG